MWGWNTKSRRTRLNSLYNRHRRKRETGYTDAEGEWGNCRRRAIMNYPHRTMAHWNNVTKFPRNDKNGRPLLTKTGEPRYRWMHGYNVIDAWKDHGWNTRIPQIVRNKYIHGFSTRPSHNR